jgi:hypothetical protein
MGSTTPFGAAKFAQVGADMIFVGLARHDN